MNTLFKSSIPSLTCCSKLSAQIIWDSSMVCAQKNDGLIDTAIIISIEEFLIVLRETYLNL